MQPNDSPPPYEAGNDTKQQPPTDTKAPLNSPDQKPSPPSETQVMTTTVAGPSSLAMPPTTVYYYHNPATQERMTSLLPPDHPEMVCMQQGHLLHTRFGILGVMAAVLWFPFGVALCLVDRRSRCDRCGHVAAEGIQCG